MRCVWDVLCWTDLRAVVPRSLILFLFGVAVFESGYVSRKRFRYKAFVS